MKRYYVTFTLNDNPVATIGVDSTAPRKAVRKGRRYLLKTRGLTGLHCSEVMHYYDTGAVNENGIMRLGIRRFIMPWKW